MGIEVEHADEDGELNDSPGKVIRSKKKSSMKIGVDLVKNGAASAFVSAGNTGAVLAYSTIILRPLKGVDRPAIAILLPTAKGTSILLDAGANVDCKSNQLFQFGIMGHAYAKYILGNDNPSVGLLSIGEEDGKGNETTKEAFKHLKKSHINFIGNVEGRDVFQGDVDVIVCDGFVGNICLKVSEGLAEAAMQMLRDEIVKSFRAKIGYLLARHAFKSFKKRVDYAEYGGAPLLGIDGIGIICHGQSSSHAIKNAILEAAKMAKGNINKDILDSLASSNSVEHLEM